ncbi:retrotrans_gag domain-containing protein, partial [Trichonephila clavipes]
EPPVKRIILEFGLLKENSRKRTKMPTEQEAKPAVVTPSLQQWRSPSTFRGAPGEDPLKWLKEQWYVNNEDALDSWEAFKKWTSGLFGDRQRYTRRAEEQLKCRAQRSGERVHKEIVQDEVERVLAPVSAKSTETRPRPTYAAVTRKYRAPVQNSHLNQEKQMCGERLTTDLFVSLRTSWTCNALLPREKGCLDNSRNRRRNLTTLALKKKYADQTLLAVLRQVPREADPQYVVTDPRRHIADPVSRQAVGARKTKQSDLPRR